MKRPGKFLTHREMLMGVPSDLFKTIKNKQMKLRIYINMICVAGLLSFFAACKKDYLDIVPTDRLSEDELLADQYFLNHS